MTTYTRATVRLANGELRTGSLHRSHSSRTGRREVRGLTVTGADGGFYTSESIAEILDEQPI